MLGFDLSQFRDLAFGRPSPADHPLADESAAHAMIAELPADPLKGLAELTHWARSINNSDSFAPEQRARVLMALDGGARPCWRELSMQYLAPDGKPAEGHDGDAAILRALLDSATEFASGYGYCIESDAQASRWIDRNLTQLALWRARGLARRFTLANMLHLPDIDHIWEELHLLHGLSEARQVWRKVIRVFPDKAITSSVKQEYTRLLLVDMANMETLRGRDIELAFRITGRIASSARLEPEAIPGAICAIEPVGASRPVAVRRLHGSGKPGLYLDPFNCLSRLKAMLEQNVDADLSEPDTMFGVGYTLRERNAMINRLIDLWGPTPPQRRFRRVALNSAALVKCGFDRAVEVIHPLQQGDWKESASTASRMQIVLDDTAAKKKAEGLKKPLEDTPVQVLDASIAGLGLRVPRKDASWAQLGMLLAVYVEPGPDWVVGALRRICGEGEFLRLGVAILSRQPKLVWFHLESTGYASVWEDEKRFEQNFLEHFQRGILIDADHAPLAPGDMLIAPGVADRGSFLDIPLAQGVQRIRVTAVREAMENFHRVAFESLGVTSHGTNDK